MLKKKKKSKQKSEVEELLESSRRDFLKKVGIVGAASVAGGTAVYSGYRFEKSKGNEYTIKVLTEENKLVEIPRDQIKDYKPGLKVFQTRGREGIEGKRWVMVIDLSRCRNARKCVDACQSAHHLRPYQYHINTISILL